MKIGYIRVSTEGQNLDRQEDSISAQVEQVFREKVSGSGCPRPELKRLLEYVREGDTVYIESLSRLARSTKDLLEIVDRLREKRVGLVSHKESIDTETPQGRFIIQVFAALSELEKESLKQRQREGIEAAKRRGKHLGRPRVKVPESFNEVVRDWAESRITAVEARKRLGLSHATFYQMVKREKGVKDTSSVNH